MRLCLQCAATLCCCKRGCVCNVPTQMLQFTIRLPNPQVSFDHNIVQYYGTCVPPGDDPDASAMIVMEYMAVRFLTP